MSSDVSAQDQAGSSRDLPQQPPDDVGVVLTGGGARAAYQVGFLRCLARNRPDFRFSIITGVSAGAINAAWLASHQGSLGDAVDELVELWSRLTPERVFRVDTPSLARGVLRWSTRLLSGGSRLAPRVRGLMDTAPLRSFLTTVLKAENGQIPGIAENLEAGLLKAVALSTANYSTGRTVTWVQGCDIDMWERPHRQSAKTRLTVDHVMASASLPLLFPAVRLDNGWYGDGGIRLFAPLSPALHLGAKRLIAISTRYRRTPAELEQPVSEGYPPPAQVVGVLANAIFLDLLDHDAMRLERINRLLAGLPPEKWDGLRAIKLVVLRPSEDLGRLASNYEMELPRGFRFLTRGLGTRETKSPDLLSMLMFEGDYIKRLIEIGEADSEARKGEIISLLRG